MVMCEWFTGTRRIMARLNGMDSFHSRTIDGIDDDTHGGVIGVLLSYTTMAVSAPS